MEAKIFEDIVHLLQGVEWLYNYPMTQVFTRDIFSHFPDDWQVALRNLPLDALNGLPQCLVMQNWPLSLQKFLKECDRLSYLSKDLGPQSFYRNNISTTSCISSSSNISKASGLQIPQEFTVGLTSKKKHEITSLLGVVKKMLDLAGSRHILDVGSGKGYIDSCIHRILSAQVCGIEGNKKLVKNAEKHHWKHYGQCKGITFLNWHLSDNVETVCRVGQLVSYLTELDLSCSCQTETQGRTQRVIGASKNKHLDSIERSETVGVCQGAASNTKERNSPPSQSESEILSLCASTYSKNPCTLLGLHACADLSPIIIKVFKDCSQASSLILLSCCYHKMSIHPKVVDMSLKDDQELTPENSDNLLEEEWSYHKMSCKSKATDRLMTSEQESAPNSISDLGEDGEFSIKEGFTKNEGFVCDRNEFVNFPMSQSLQEVFRQNNFHMSIFGLRLGAQESGQKWKTETYEEHEYHLRNVAYRGILEAACVEEGFTLKKLRRRCARKTSFGDFVEYKKDILENYEFHKIYSNDKNEETNNTSSCQAQNSEVRNDTENTHISTALDSCYENYKHYFPMIEPLTGLQLALQPVIEMMIQVDRLTYLKECGFSRVWLEKVFDPEVSPRNIALLALR